MALHTLTIDLPSGYLADDVLAFHGRDTEGVAERVEPGADPRGGHPSGRIRKGVLLAGAPALLDVSLTPRAALCAIHIDGDDIGGVALAQAREALLNILGLRIDPAPFVAQAQDDLLLGPVVRRRPGLRIVQSATVFEALTWAIIGQQINLQFAIALRRTFILQAGRQHSSGLWCYPEAAGVARLDVEALTSRKFSRSKAETLLRLAQLVASGELTLAREDDAADVAPSLLAVKGIGPWTVNYALLRGYGYADCSLHGDVAIRSAFQRLLGAAEKPDMPRTEALLEAYKPHRTMAAAYLWASLG
jgi:DNA-3-methyladenine glycosylase II